ncbi:Uncharacterised protein r2_g1323 [Pycnogonum litorale]
MNFFSLVRVLALMIAIVFDLNCCSAEECPPKEDIYPCECLFYTFKPNHILKVTCSNIENLQTVRQSFSQTENRIHFYLNDLKMKHIPKDFLEGMNVDVLEIDSSIESIDPEAFKYNTLDLLVLRNPKLEKNFPRAFKSLFSSQGYPNLLMVNSNNGGNSHSIRMTKADTGNLPDNVRSLYLEKNGIEAIEPGSFIRFTYLRSLSLSYNNLVALNGRIFPPRMKQLKLNWNKLTEIPIGSLSSIEGTLTVVMNHNKVQSLPSQQEIKKLSARRINVFAVGNPLNCNCDFKWYPEYRNTPNSIFRLSGRCLGDEKRKWLSIASCLDRDFADCS